MSWFNLNLKTQVAGLWDISLYDKQCLWWGIGSVFLSRLRFFLPKFNFWKEYFSPLRARLCLQNWISLQLRQHCRWYFGWLWQIQNQKQWMMMRRAGLSTAGIQEKSQGGEMHSPPPLLPPSQIFNFTYRYLDHDQNNHVWSSSLWTWCSLELVPTMAMRIKPSTSHTNSPNDDGHPDNCDDDRFQNQLMWQMDSCKIVSIWNGLKISY